MAEAVGAAVLGILAATGNTTVANLAVFSFFMGTAFMLSIPAIQALQRRRVHPVHITRGRRYCTSC